MRKPGQAARKTSQYQSCASPPSCRVECDATPGRHLHKVGIGPRCAGVEGGCPWGLNSEQCFGLQDLLASAHLLGSGKARRQPSEGKRTEEQATRNLRPPSPRPPYRVSGPPHQARHRPAPVVRYPSPLHPSPAGAPLPVPRKRRSTRLLLPLLLPLRWENPGLAGRTAVASSTRHPPEGEREEARG